METRNAARPSWRELPFLNFLRGMETLPQVFVHALPHLFLNFLRGMETYFSPVGWMAIYNLPKLP